MKSDEISDIDRGWNITEETCMVCRKQERTERSEINSDFSPLHSDAIVQDFGDHEDHDPK